MRRRHPELVAAVVASAASDYAPLAIARALQDPPPRCSPATRLPPTVRLRARARAGAAVRADLLAVSVTYDGRGYVGHVPGLAQPVVALSLNGLRRRVEAVLMPEDVIVMLQLDRAARLERDARRRGGPGRAGDYARPR